MRNYFVVVVVFSVAFLALGCGTKAFLYKKKPIPAEALIDFHPDIVSGDHDSLVNLDSVYYAVGVPLEGKTVFPDTFWLNKYQRLYNPLSDGGFIDYVQLGYDEKQNVHVILSRLYLGGTLTTSELFLVGRKNDHLILKGKKSIPNLRDHVLRYEQGVIYMNNTPIQIDEILAEGISDH